MRRHKCAPNEQKVVDDEGRPQKPLTGLSESIADYYSCMEEDFDTIRLTRGVYATESESLQHWIKKLWYQYKFSLPLERSVVHGQADGTSFMYCQFREKDPVETLKPIPINVLHDFLHWMLRERSETLRTASLLRTNWNRFCLVRKREIGCHEIDPLIKSQMHGVS